MNVTIDNDALLPDPDTKYIVNVSGLWVSTWEKLAEAMKLSAPPCRHWEISAVQPDGLVICFTGVGFKSLDDLFKWIKKLNKFNEGQN